METIQVPVGGWIAFGALVLGLLIVDLLAHRNHHANSKRSAIAWSAGWIFFGLGFGVFVWRMYGSQPAHEYLGAWLIEKSLSLDNLFVFLVIFRSLSIPEAEQRRVLFWGIFGALVFRALFIFAGVEALEHWHAVVYVFGAILLFTAFRVAREDPLKERDSKMVHWLARRLPVSSKVEGSHFVVRQGGRLLATPLLVALITIEFTDVAFALDSVPAALSVSQDPFIVYTSNVFAILGLRALYIALAHVITQLRYLHYGLAAVLAFAGLKMVIPSNWVHVSPLVSVGVIVVCIGTSIVASVVWKRRHPRQQPSPPAGTDAQGISARVH
ncbi:TerC family protein [Stigmatella aurantiaca]|uniref:Membrane protein, TerC family n=1 Tax=Stigmatella aurantiaca (strain DW4/3-1) TaxID=378806 RepID=Q08XR2_STIAD|nr:TerC family protein [Stigmatella aurantiaca]ADO73424.1 Integral membrane protein, TerC family [Stigmatella aurantiaca DW4/3-1]EAU65294.1 membrane protein, TerC family [Stigmatella aurantiaca DW4/3-1]